jgi:MFS family permease
MLIAGRAIAGLGAAGLASGCYTIVALSAPPRLRPAFTGILGATWGVGSVVGPLLGGVFTDKVTWRWWYVHCHSTCLGLAITDFQASTLIYHLELLQPLSFLFFSKRLQT